MKIIKKIINIIGTFFILMCIPCVYAINPYTIDDNTPNNPDVPNLDHQTYSIFDIISLINSYLRLAIGLICFIVIIWNGIKLIIARGDSKEMKAATHALIGCTIELLVCILAYIIVNLVLKLFA